MDDAFMPLHETLAKMLAFSGEIVDEDRGIRSHIYECAIESPLELTVTKTAEGGLDLGSTPPLYYVETSIRPSYHRVSFSAHSGTESDGD